MTESDQAHLDESERERVDRNLTTLLEELRVAMPGVQVLFGFLLAVPFQQRFASVTDFQTGVYFFTLVSSATATALFIAPTAYHRIVFRLGDKRHLVFQANRFAIAGLVALALAMNGAVLLIADIVFAERWAVVLPVAAVSSLYVWLWFAFPLWRRLHHAPRADG